MRSNLFWKWKHFNYVPFQSLNSYVPLPTKFSYMYFMYECYTQKGIVNFEYTFPSFKLHINYMSQFFKNWHNICNYM